MGRLYKCISSLEYKRANEDIQPLMLLSPIMTPNYITKTYKETEKYSLFPVCIRLTPRVSNCAPLDLGDSSVYGVKKEKECLHQILESTRQCHPFKNEQILLTISTCSLLEQKVFQRSKSSS